MATSKAKPVLTELLIVIGGLSDRQERSSSYAGVLRLMIPIEVARSLRGERLASIRAGRAVVTLMDEGPIVVVHCIPVRRDPFAINLDVGSIDSGALVPPGRRESSRYLFDFDGVLSTAPGHAGKVYGYAELCRNGVIEAVDTALVRPQSDYGGSARFFPGTPLVGAIVVGTLRFLQLQTALGVQPPIAFGLSLLRVAGLYVGPMTATATWTCTPSCRKTSSSRR
jgi:hypothetical protein